MSCRSTCPRLRERGDDVIEIAEAALARFATEEGRAFDGLAMPVKSLFRRLPWPGNVRQVLNVIRNVVVLNEGGLVTVAMLPADLATDAIRPAGASPDLPGPDVPQPDSLIGLTLGRDRTAGDRGNPGAP